MRRDSFAYRRFWRYTKYPLCSCGSFTTVFRRIYRAGKNHGGKENNDAGCFWIGKQRNRQCDFFGLCNICYVCNFRPYFRYN